MSNAKKSTKKKIKNKSSDNINKLKKPAKSKIKKEAIPKYEIATKTNDENERLYS